MAIVFYIAALIAVVSTVMVITRLNAVHALLYLIVSLLAVAVVFFVIGAPFVAALEVIVYAGAILVLFVFVIMMLNLGPASTEQENMWFNPRVWAGPAVLSVILAIEVFYVLAVTTGQKLRDTVVPPRQVGFSLYTDYLLAVELAAMLLLAGIVGAYHLGRFRRLIRHRFIEQQEEIIK